MNCNRYRNLDDVWTCNSSNQVCRDFKARAAREVKARDDAELKEPYFVSYAVRGPMACPNTCQTNRLYEHAVRYGMPSTFPLSTGDVRCPSPLECNGWDNPPDPHAGIM